MAKGKGKRIRPTTNRAVTLDDLLDDAASRAQRAKPKGKVETWLDDNPEKAKLFWQAIASAESLGLPVGAIVEASQSQLGGPPGAPSTISRVINDHEE